MLFVLAVREAAVSEADATILVNMSKSGFGWPFAVGVVQTIGGSLLGESNVAKAAKLLNATTNDPKRNLYNH